ncbi:hypothetical protein SERLA73DRAFT_143958, partial [Serpula lacrymans var. lacrymans S7.3]
MDLRKLSWLTICLPWLVTATGLPRSASTESLVAECNFVLGGLYFDLCPIIRAPTRTLHSSNRQYEFDLGERIREISNDKRHDCPDGTWICMTGNDQITFISRITTKTRICPDPLFRERGSLTCRPH